MELRHLRYFVAVAEEENISRAALKLHVSQPGISRQIHDLEGEIGFSLFERRGKTVRLTVAGKIFFSEARDILQRTADAVEKARAGLASRVEINVGFIPALTTEILPRTVRAFRGYFPGVRVTLRDLFPEEALPLLHQRKLDIALTLLRQKLPRELEMKELARYEPCVFVGKTHPLAKSKFVSLNQVASEPVATYSRKDHPGFHKHFKKLFASVGRTPRIGSEHNSVSSLLATVAAGNEVALLASCVSRMAGPRLKLLNLRPALPKCSLVALWHKNTEEELVKAFIAALPNQPKDERLPTR
jgi:LysR family transcriptional regulator, benzoate and cis,cis-muconate-responsive activator of ben and cat genes